MRGNDTDWERKTCYRRQNHGPRDKSRATTVDERKGVRDDWRVEMAPIDDDRVQKGALAGAPTLPDVMY